MYQEINKKIQEAHNGLARRRKLESLLQDLKQEDKKLNEKLQLLKSALDKESSDYNKVKEGSITKMFYAILGSLDEQLEKERQEMLAARLKYDQCQKDCDYVRQQIAKYTAESQALLYCEKDYETYYDEKRKILLARMDQNADKLMSLTERGLKIESNLKELTEAVESGSCALSSICLAKDLLESAEGWGTWDVVAGGFISTAMKHSKVDQAEEEIERAQQQLRSFKAELTDIQVDENMRIQINNFDRFTDYFFDGLLFDWIVLSKIENALESVEIAEAQVRNALSNLVKMQEKNRLRLEELKGEIDQLILKG